MLDQCVTLLSAEPVFILSHQSIRTLLETDGSQYSRLSVHLLAVRAADLCHPELSTRGRDTTNRNWPVNSPLELPLKHRFYEYLLALLTAVPIFNIYSSLVRPQWM